MSSRKDNRRKGSVDSWLQQQLSPNNEICKCCRRELGLIVRNIAMFRGKCQNCRQKICSACVVTNLCHKCRVQRVVCLNPVDLMQLPAKKLIEIATTLHFHNPQGYEKSELVQLILAIYGLKWTRPIPQEPVAAVESGNGSQDMGKCEQCRSETPATEISNGLCRKCDVVTRCDFQPQTLMKLSVKDLLDVLDAFGVPRTEVVVQEKGELVMMILKKLGRNDGWTPPIPKQPFGRSRSAENEALNTSVINNRVVSLHPPEDLPSVVQESEEPMEVDENEATTDDFAEPHRPSTVGENDFSPQRGSVSSSASLGDIHGLEDIPSAEVIQDLKVQQLKAILEQYRVDIEGCCEKKDLADQVTVLWSNLKAIPTSIPYSDDGDGSPSTRRSPVFSADDQRRESAEDSHEEVAAHRNDAEDVSQSTNGRHQRETTDSPSTDTASATPAAATTNPHIILAGEVPPLKSLASADAISALSVRQLKAVLQKYSVDYSLCREREELAALVRALWEDANKWKGSEAIPDEDVCKICMDAAIDCVLLECGHMVACTECGRQMSECPVCRQFVTRVVHTFKA